MSAAALTEIIAGVPVVAAAIVSIIVAIKSNNRTTAMAATLAEHINAHSS
jgi:hypothetical protein